ncbi:OmpA family protein [Sagittula sp. SSi028]|uniref:OmpA family protein n=1 Tax=Sagittula sp. SSi028 TaxID=3400636 RepID=UPI003AF8CF26
MWKIFKQAAVAATLLAPAAFAQSADPFAKGWTLDGSQSVLSFQTIKNVEKVEVHSFQSFRGTIDEAGKAELIVDLDSVETKVDMRNVRLRFILFETFEDPEARISLQIPPAVLNDLETLRRKRITLPYTMDFVGLSREFQTDVIVTLLDNDTVSVASAQPVSYSISTFELEERLQRLEETVDVDVIPSATFSFNLAFNRNGSTAAPETLNLASVGAAPAGGLSLQDCQNRFKAISISGRITFDSGSAALQPYSRPLLEAISETVLSCPQIALRVSGHTDSQGNPELNRRLSTLRAQSVADALSALGVSPSALSVVGHGDSQPIADNATARGRERNRRIEFAVMTGS